ncbi:CASP-like protein [Vigna angularis]|uniref:CASP-like protein n=1 Tax=Phaseolus angularis TaxID=3914 RepID=A0A8T0L443_PHAAN|nr:CASP-like protein [Vigna angularis]
MVSIKLKKKGEPVPAAFNASPTSPPFSFIHPPPDPAMSSHTKTNLDGVHSDVKVVERPTKERSHDLFLRFLGLSLTLVATILVGVDNQTKVISYAEMKFRATAKWEYISAMVFFVVSNAIACSYAAASLVITVMARSSGTKKSDLTDLVITALDLVLMALLFSANGAACAVGIIAQKGNKHLQWMKVCDVFDAYCRHMTAALVLSIIGSTVFLLLVLHSVLKLHYRSRS